MTEPRLYLTSMCGPSNVDNLTEMVEPVLQHLDGLVFALNDCPIDDPGARYLESVKGAGCVVHRPWAPGRHSHVMNDTLYCGPIEEGDYVLYVDDLERPMLRFVSRVKTEIGPMMNEADLDVLAYFGKSYLIRFRETMEYRGSPHWFLTGTNGRAIEYSKIEPDETKVRFNARPLKRGGDRFHFVKHYLGYALYPAGSNHYQLGLDGYPNGAALFREREQNRLNFITCLRRLGIRRDSDAVLEYMRGPMDLQFVAFVETDKVLNDAYRLYVLNKRDFTDNHDWSDMVRVQLSPA